MVKIVNDVIHGHIELSDIAWKIIDTPEFQRLRNLKQLGMTYYVYPGAEHTRFQHCIGTYYLAKKQMEIFFKNQPELKINSNDIELVGIAGLCHDLGHGPFSHSYENWIQSKYSKGELKDEPVHHEQLSIEILTRINNRLRLFTSKDLMKICEMINPSGQTINKFMYQIVCNKQNGIDVDKFDYLKRDSYYTNKPTSFDHIRLMINAKVIDDNICYAKKEVYNLYELFRTRYSMYRQVYLHKVIKGVEYMMMDLLDMIDNVINLSSATRNITRYLQYNDSVIELSKYISNKNSKTQDLIHRIETRKLYKCIYYKLFDEERWQEEDIVEKIKSHLNVEMLQKVRIDVTKLNYGMYNQNPVDNVFFYGNDSEKSFKIAQESVSFLLPSHFIEYHLRIYVTTKSVEEEIKKIIDDVLSNKNNT